MLWLGSPAHAGIDPGLRRLSNPDTRFPRTRGDRPAVEFLGGVLDEVPPHTRG